MAKRLVFFLCVDFSLKFVVHKELGVEDVLRCLLFKKDEICVFGPTEFDYI